MILTGEDKNLPHCHFVLTNPTWDDLGSNPASLVRGRQLTAGLAVGLNTFETLAQGTGLFRPVCTWADHLIPGLIFFPGNYNT